ncbi:MAG: DPP IV N-terminal domain-containing protein, partial [Bacteroidales bacterium]
QSVHRSEFGIKKGTFWSPSGEYLAYYRKDETMVTDYPLVNIDSRIATEENIKYPMAGMTSEEVTLMVFHPVDSSYITLNTGRPADQYLTSITWSPDDQFIYVGILNRGQDHLKLNKYSAKTGELVITLFEEKHDKYVEPLFPLYFPYPDSSHFIWFSQRDGFQHMYLYNARGHLIRQLTEGPWVVTRYLGADSENNIAYFLSTRNSPLNEDIFSVQIATGEIQSLSLNTGTHSPVIHPEGRYFIDIYSDTLTSREFAIIDNRGKVLQIIHRSDDPLKEYKKCRTRIFTLTAEDSTALYARMIYPPDFNPRKKHPVIVYIYGGPHAQLVNNTWLGGAGLFLYYMAQQGYIVFTLDNRGSANRGLDFEQAIFRNLGKVEAIDQMTGVNYLRSLPYVDTGRIGLNGWSYGGFMTIYLMLSEPDVFKAGVCGGPVTDWKYYEVMYGERYMDTPEENPDGYAESSLLTHASRLKGKLLIIHGTSDPVVVWQHSLALMKKFIEEGIMADYFVYPGHGHGVGGKDRVHLNRKIEKFFRDHL